MNNLKNEKGITLISLVITIVVLTIIATITISASNLNNGLVDETVNATKQSQINKYIELIEITRQEAMSREYALEIKAKSVAESEGRDLTEDELKSLVLNEIKSIMNSNYSDEIYKVARDEAGNDFTITGIGDSAYIIFETIEGYIFHIYKDRTEYIS